MNILYKNWVVHNLIAHPLMQIIRIFNRKVATKLHDATLPLEGKSS